MKIMIEIGHPGHVHHFKNMIWDLQKKGHDVCICTTDKDVTISLLNSYGFKYEILGINIGKNLLRKMILLLKSEYIMLKRAYKFRPDLFISRVSPVSAHISTIFRKPHLTFSDTEHPRLTDALALPFTDIVCTPSCYLKDLCEKHIRYDGYTELAYLHPNYFTPNPAVLDEIGLTEDDAFIILRFVSWDATHDVGHSGIQNKMKLVQKLEKYGRVLITSEGKLDDELEKYQIKVSPEKMHDLLYYANLYVGEGATMATESAILGTPAIYVSSLVGTMGNFIELEEKYGLMFNYRSSEKILDKIIELIQKKDLKQEWKTKLDILFDDKIDVTEFMVDLVENNYGNL